MLQLEDDRRLVGRGHDEEGKSPAAELAHQFDVLRDAGFKHNLYRLKESAVMKLDAAGRPRVGEPLDLLVDGPGGLGGVGRDRHGPSGGDVTLVNVAIEMDIPPELPAGQWVLWEMERAASLRLRQSSLTVRNGLGHDVTVFRARPSPETDRIGSTREGEPAAPTEIEIDDCVIRGRATIVRAEGLQPVQLAWNNGLLVTDQWFLWAQGGDRDAATGDAIVIRLKHLTGVVGQGLCRLDNSRLAPARQLPVRVDCSDSLLLVTSPQGALIELLGEYPHNLQEWFTWTGDRNGYSGSTVFHRMDDLTYHLPPEVVAVFVGTTATVCHSLGDLPFRSPAILTVWLLSFVCADGFLPAVRSSKARTRSE